MPSLWFVVPVHGRLRLASICLRQLRNTCDSLLENGIDASAVIIADADNLRELRRRLSGFLGFGRIVRDNRFLSQRYNDGIQLACDSRFNPRPADYVVPCGSDDWVDYRIFLELPRRDTVLGFQRISFVREDGREMTTRFLNYEGGCGIRVYPRQVVATLKFRPADEDRVRACDTSILTNLRRAARFRIEHREIDPRQIVDWKTHGQQVTPYEAVANRHRGDQPVDPFEALADIFPEQSLRKMAAIYGLSRELARA